MIEVLAHGQTVGFLSVVPFPGSESTFGGGDYALNHNQSPHRQGNNFCYSIR